MRELDSKRVSRTLVLCRSQVLLGQVMTKTAVSGLTTVDRTLDSMRSKWTCAPSR